MFIWLALRFAIVVLVDQPTNTSLIQGNVGECNVLRVKLMTLLMMTCNVVIIELRLQDGHQIVE